MSVNGLIITNLAEFRRDLEQADAARTKNGRAAVRIEANRLRLKLKEEIRAGAPGGQTFAPLSVIARRYVNGRERRPLERLAIPVRYWEHGPGTGRKVISVGYNGGEVVNLRGQVFKSNQLSASWIRLAAMHQQGYSYPIPELGRAVLRHRGGELKRQGWHGEAKFYFLRKRTRRLTVPARKIIDPFWRAHQGEAAANILANFERKMRGEKI